MAIPLFLLAACGGGGGSGDTSEAQWHRDIDFLVRESQRINPDLFHTVSRSEYLQAADDLKDVSGLTRNQIFVRLKKLLALPATREDGHTLMPLFQALQDDTIDQPGKLYVLIDRLTFSAAANFVTELDSSTGAIFVGEPTGGSLNNYGDVERFDLPNSGFGVQIPTIYWVYAAPGDQRIAIAPDPGFTVDVTASHFFNNEDPVLQAVLDL